MSNFVSQEKKKRTRKQMNFYKKKKQNKKLNNYYKNIKYPLKFIELALPLSHHIILFLTL